MSEGSAQPTAISCDDPEVAVDRVLRQVLREADLALRPGEIPVRESRAHLVEWHGTQAILRCVPTPRGLAGSLGQDVRWLHSFLIRLTDLGFPAPRPLPAFAGKSWTAVHGVLWEVVSYLPGHSVGWADQPSMEDVGGLLARYHAMVRSIEVSGQRPSALPLAEVPAVLLSGSLESAGVTADECGVIRHLAERLAGDLRAARSVIADRVIIHGDFTNDNVLASGAPPSATGVIDFALAHAETPLADIGYALWRSGRPAEHARRLDLTRVRRYLRGYRSVMPLSADQASVIPVYLLGRGLQMIAKRARAAQPETGMLAQVRWLSANAGAVTDAMVDAGS